MTSLSIKAMSEMFNNHNLGRTVQVIRDSLDKTIIALELQDNILKLTFQDKTVIKIWDRGQACCEKRYMRTDDDLNSYIDSKFVDLEVRDAPSTKDEHDDVHEVQFLYVRTDKGDIVFSNHDEHNGWYGMFEIAAELSSE